MLVLQLLAIRRSAPAPNIGPQLQRIFKLNNICSVVKMQHHLFATSPGQQ